MDEWNEYTLLAKALMIMCMSVAISVLGGVIWLWVR